MRKALTALLFLGLAGSVEAQEVYNPSYALPNIGLPHVRIAPEQHRWNAYQNPLTAPHRTEPWRRDNDGDGIPNAFDYDDNDNKLQPQTLIQSLLPPRD